MKTYLSLTTIEMKILSIVRWNVLVMASVCLICQSCGNPGNNDGAKAAGKTFPKKASTSELAEKLYTGYHQTPTTQAQKDENALIDYAVDKNMDVKRTTSGLYYLITEKGEGENYKYGQRCEAHYRGTFLDGKEFDSSYKRGQPMGFNVGQMIPGWNEALMFINPGTKISLLVPSHLAYGAAGFPGYIGPHTPLAFDIETQALD